jgi:hypothetical protein
MISHKTLRILRTFSVIKKTEAEMRLAAIDQNIRNTQSQRAMIEGYIGQIKGELADDRQVTGYDFRCLIGYIGLSVVAINRGEVDMERHIQDQQGAITRLAEETEKQKAIDQLSGR